MNPLRTECFVSTDSLVARRYRRDKIQRTRRESEEDAGRTHAVPDRCPADVSSDGRRTGRAARFLAVPALGGLGVGAPALLSACGTTAAKQTAESCVSTDLSRARRRR